MHLRSLNDFDSKTLLEVIDKAIEIKKNPENYKEALKDKTLLMIFAKPSLRTRISFEVGLTQMGGHAIYYDVATSPLGKKESLADTAKTASRYVDIIMARLFKQEDIEELAKFADVPVINALTDKYHPCQIIADLQTIKEKKGELKGLKLAYFGDGNNNIPHSLLLGCSMAGMHIACACPEGASPQADVVERAQEIAKKTGSQIEITTDPQTAIKEADVVCTDSWMSYHVPEDQKEERIKIFKPYQVNADLMQKAKPDAIFIHCLPAMREMEVTAEVIDGPQSVVFDEAENRLHSQKAVMLKLLGYF